MPPLSKGQARAIINDIRKERGCGISRADREQIPPSVRQSWEFHKRGHRESVNKLANDVYSTDTRYLFELIQNADDNQYNSAIREAEDPYIKFTLYKDRVLVDSNEDGFSEGDVRAICSTGNSTKSQAEGCIGEKGIGFKSVFKIASKVHIQSSPFSFSLTNTRDEDGLGMLTPLNENHKKLPDGVTTRMTLTLRDRSGYDSSVQAAEQIPDACILFLSKLNRISVSAKPKRGEPWEIAYSNTRDRSATFVQLTKAVNHGRLNFHYRVARRTVSSLPEDSFHVKRGAVEVVLAFPVNESSVPIIEDQHVFSFLPVRKVGFNFIVQSDFVIQAGREAIHESDRNNAILDGVAQTFCDAVIQFQRDPRLRYSWLDYVPGDHIPDPFWGQLRGKIFACLKSARVFRSWKGKLKYLHDLRYLHAEDLDKHSKPLFHDLRPGCYLSHNYQPKHRELLFSMGVTALQWSERLERIKPYLEGSNPRILLSACDDDWHTRVAELLLKGLKQDQTAAIKSLPLIPLLNGELRSVESNDIFFATDQKGNFILTDLGLLLVDHRSVQNSKRKTLFLELGVQYCKSTKVTKAMKQKYLPPISVSLDDSVSHIVYLYLTLPKDNSLDYRVFLFSQERQPVYRTRVTIGLITMVVDDLYFETHGAYGTRKLADAIASTPGNGKSREPVIRFLHSSYLDKIPSDTRRHGRSWEEWLETIAGVRRVPRLRQSPQRNYLSTVFETIITRRPDLLVGVLKTYWDDYDAFDKSPEVILALKAAVVPCENTEPEPLKKTYLPLTELKVKSADLSVQDSIPFLRLPAEWDSDDLREWRFLENLGVRMSINLEFFLKALEYLVAKIQGSVWNAEIKSSLLKIYEEISDRCREDKDAEKIQHRFHELEAIYVPGDGSTNVLLAAPGECVWDAPSFLRSKHALGLHEDYSQNRKIKSLFCEVLEIQSATFTTYLVELEKMRERGLVHDVYAVYSELWKEIGTESQRETVRNKFESGRLLYVPPQDQWYAPTSCLWTSTWRVGSQVGVADSYADLARFFVDTLHINEPTVETFVGQLKTVAASDAPNIYDVKSAICSINELNPAAGDLDNLNGVKFLPVKLPDGRTVLEDSEKEFFIADRVEYSEAFEDRVPILDLSLDETRQLRPFLLALGLDGRYMSLAVKHTTTVIRPATDHAQRLTCQIREKATALVRCAAHFQSSRAQNEGHATRRTLREARIYESEGFSKFLSVSHEGHSVTAESGRCIVHFEEQDSNLKIFVPHNRRDRRLCYLSQLPQALASYFGITDPAARGIFQSVIRSEMDILEDFLEDVGIVSVDSNPALDARDGSEGFESDESIVEVTSTPHTFAYPRPLIRPATPQSAPNTEDTDPEAESTMQVPQDLPLRNHLSRPRGSRRSSGQPMFDQPNDLLATNPGDPVNSPLYAGLLDHVVNAARRSRFPTLGAFDLRGLADALPSSTSSSEQPATAIDGRPFGNRSLSRFQQDILIGAAGELFVFEMLLQLDLPGFGRQNWRSNIRKEVQVHPDYHDLEPWSGVETTDIVYQDTTSVFTRLLIDNGFLHQDRWQSAQPKYHIEVKSTLSDCATAFYMSKGQFNRMQRMRLGVGPGEEVFLIFRVYNIGKDNVGVWIYMDPESMRVNETLEFTPEAYSVVPRRPLDN